MKAQWHATLICWTEIFHCYRLGVCKLDVTSDLTVEPYTLISMPWTKTVVARWQFADSTSTGKECLLLMETEYKVGGATRLWATLACDVNQPVGPN